jgi:hypothetical protein
MLKHPLKGLLTSLRGPKTEGAMITEPTPAYEVAASGATLAGIPIKVER